MINNKILVLYGSTGDLTFRKLLPSLVELKEKNEIDSNFKILALGRRDFDKKNYVNFINENNPSLDLTNILEQLDYLKMEITVKEDYEKLKKHLDVISDENTQVIHFLAISPTFMRETANYLSYYKIVEKGNFNHSLVFEKPFGNNLIEAVKLNNFLDKRFNEKQIYRIDHYLGKDIINKIFYYRFKSNLFKSVFEKRNISKIDVVLKEADGVLNRGSFFDETGIVKDMFQGHILQIVSLITMNEPRREDSNFIRKEKMRVLRRLKFEKDSFVFGQYQNYLNEKDVQLESKTETFFKGTFYISGEYNNVKINVLTGKKLDEKETYINIHLKDGSEIKLEMYPKNSLHIKSDLKYTNIDYKQNFNESFSDYGNLFISLINNNKQDFVGRDEVELAWKITEEVLKNKKELVIYNEDYLI